MENINVRDENSFEVRYLYLHLSLKKQFSIITIHLIQQRWREKKSALAVDFFLINDGGKMICDGE